MSGRPAVDVTRASRVRGAQTRGVAFAVVLLALGVPTAAQAQTESVEYYGLDALGSVRVVFDASGTIVGRMDYGPFGQELLPSTGKQQQIYAGLFADGEAGLDHADAREYQVRTGRFSSVDPIYAGLFEPQRWNRYSYALNRPLEFLDPSGLQTYSEIVTVTAQDSWIKMSDMVAFFLGWGGGGGGGNAGDPAAGGGFGVQKGKARDGTADESSTENSNVSTAETADVGILHTTIEGCKGGVQGLAGFVDGAIPYADPFMSAGAYAQGTPADYRSQKIGSLVRDFAVLELGSGALAGQIAIRVAAAAKNGNTLAKILGNNRYVRIGKTYMGGPGKTPALRFLKMDGEWGNWLSHVDLRANQVFSKTAPTIIKRIQRMCGR